jgi:hypothetical protein
MFTSSQGYNVVPPSGDGGPYLVQRDRETAYYTDTLKDECSCAAIQGIGCEHKTAVDEYVEHAAKQITDDAQPSPDVQAKPTTADHRPTYERRQVGMTDTKPARPLWATDVTCSCGFEDKASEPRTKDDARAVFKTHKQQAEDTTPPPIYPSREDWLMEAMRHIHARAALLQLGDNPPKTRVACGFTYSKGRTAGECWRKEQSGDGSFEIIVHNREANPVTVLGFLVHEIGHTFMEKDTGHRAPFQRWAKAMGYNAPYTESHPGEELLGWLTDLAATLGTYPHAPLDSARRIREGGPKKQTNRWLKWTCSHPGCGWIVRTAKPDFRGACISELHPDAPALFVPSFTTEPGPTQEEGPESE